MTRLDKRFALIRDGRSWYAAAIEDQGTGMTTFRISERSQSRDAHGLAEQLTDLETVAQRVLKEGKRMRCAPEGCQASSLDLGSRGVTGYRLDPDIAAKLRLSAEGGVQ